MKRILLKRININEAQIKSKCGVEHTSTGSWAPSDGVRVGCPRYALRSEYKQISKRIFIHFKANKRVRFTLIRFEANN